MFSPGNLPSLTADELKELLPFKDKQHWHRMYLWRNQIVQDMDALRDAPALLLGRSAHGPGMGGRAVFGFTNLSKVSRVGLGPNPRR